MDEIQPQLKHAVIFWWACTWRTILIVIPIALFIGFFFGMAAALLGVEVAAIEALMSAIGYLLGVAVYIYILQRMLSHSFGGFRIALLPVDSPKADGPENKSPDQDKPNQDFEA